MQVVDLRTGAPGAKGGPASNVPAEPLLIYDPEKDEDEGRRATLQKVYVPAHLAAKLRPHQVAGVTFMFECLAGLRVGSHTGAILMDGGWGWIPVEGRGVEGRGACVEGDVRSLQLHNGAADHPGSVIKSQYECRWAVAVSCQSGGRGVARGCTPSIECCSVRSRLGGADACQTSRKKCVRCLMLQPKYSAKQVLSVRYSVDLHPARSAGMGLGKTFQAICTLWVMCTTGEVFIDTMSCEPDCEHECLTHHCRLCCDEGSNKTWE